MPRGSEGEKEHAEEPKPKKTKTFEEKRTEYLDRIMRTFVASIAGAVAGILSFLLTDHVTGFLLMILAIVMQKYIYNPLRRGLPPLGGKDWFYQSFMTFSLWFIVLTILLSTAQ